MNDMRLRSKYEKYHRAINSLRVAVQWAPDDGNMYLDATIKRFDFCFQLVPPEFPESISCLQIEDMPGR